MPEVKCPKCGKIIEYNGNEFRPFCSERCKLIDFGAWANEEFALPTQDTALSEEDFEQIELIGPAGTFGAFIKILSPIPSRKAVFDIGVAGPIAGFLALVPVGLIGFLTFQQVSPAPASIAETGVLYFSDPLFFKFLALLFGINLSIPMYPNPFYFAAWVGLLVTALNLVPSGQLDGGHAVYSIFGSRVHQWTGKIAFVLMTIFSILGWFLYSSPSGFLFAVILAVMMRVRHPEPLDDAPLDAKRKIVAVLTLLIFVLCFTPFPIQIK